MLVVKADVANRVYSQSLVLRGAIERMCSDD